MTSNDDNSQEEPLNLAKKNEFRELTQKKLLTKERCKID
jgi:hypothetical protein